MNADLISTPDGCNDREAVAAARFVASQAARLGAESDLAVVLEALGLLQPASRVSVGVRDSIGRLRATQPQQSASPDVEPDPIPPGQHGHAGRCASGDHPWTVENIRPAGPTAPARCRPCEQRRNRRGISSKPPPNPDGVTVCRCPGKHVLTAHTSDTTYVSPGGKRQCKVAMARRKREKRAAA